MYFYIILLLAGVLILSCKNKNTVFFYSKEMNLILIKNLPKDISILKIEIKKYLIERKVRYAQIYEYSSNTKYFLENIEDDGGPTSMHFLSNYQKKEGIALFDVKEYENDSIQEIGIIRYYEKYGDFYTPDTIYIKYKQGDK